jgi:UDP-glucose-4-epimerase GalE
MSTVLVTGGAGYIGSHAVKALRATGRRVVVFDSLAAGHAAAVGDATLVKGDVRNTAEVEAALSRYDVTAVMHFAALLSVGESVREPARYYDNNVRGSLSLLDAMRATGVQRLVFSSTCAVYGDPVTVPIDEQHATQPINAYGESKLAVERALRHYGTAYGLRSVALRYFNAAGADPDGALGEDHDPEIHLIPRAIEAACGGAPLQLFGDDYPTADGTCERDYVHVSDLANAHLLALDSMDTGAASKVYNLGTGRPHSVREVIRSVERVAGRRVPTESAPRRPGDPAVLCAAAGRIGTELGWRPAFTSLDEVVDTAWRWHDAHPHGFDESVGP